MILSFEKPMQNFRGLVRWLAMLALVGTLSACESAYYGLYEQFGILKNDLLVDSVEEAVEAQEEAKEEFKSAFEQFEAVVGVPESDLKKVYNRLSGSFEDAEDKAKTVSERIESVEDVSEDLFEEWESEIEQISNASLKQQSKSQLRTSRTRYGELMRAMRAAESRMEPVLTSFRDHVLFLKHNLNAQAIASLKGELGGIETNVGRLIDEMEKSISEAQDFLATMEAG